jgi:hypothetical protein
LEEIFRRNVLRGIFSVKCFGRNSLGGILWEKFFVYIVTKSQLSYLNMEGIDLFVKILSQGRRKEEFLILRSATQAHRT